METIVLYCRRAIMFWMCKGVHPVTFARNHSNSRLFQTRLSMSIWTSILAFVRQHNFRTELAPELIWLRRNNRARLGARVKAKGGETKPNRLVVLLVLTSQALAPALNPKKKKKRPKCLGFAF